MTPAQKAILQADILAKQQAGQPFEGVTNEDTMAVYYNVMTGVTAWRTDMPTKLARSFITLSSYTPNDAADGTAIYTNRLLIAQAKQINLQLMTQGVDTLDMSLPQARNDLRDAVIQLPTGTAGAMVSASGASGANVLNACTRDTNRVEVLFAAASKGSDQTGTVTARVLTWEGPITSQIVSDAILGR